MARMAACLCRAFAEADGAELILSLCCLVIISGKGRQLRNGHLRYLYHLLDSNVQGVASVLDGPEHERANFQLRVGG